MNDCRQFQEMMEELLAGDIAAESHMALSRHCQSCPECAGLFELHEKLQLMNDEIPEPGRTELRDMREAVLERISLDPVSAPARRSFWPDLVSLWQIHPAASMAAMVILLAGAVFMGRWSTPAQTLDDSLILQAISRQADQQSGLGEYWDAPLSFANVTARQKPSGRLALSFDVSRHVEVLTPQSSALAREVLLHAIIEPSSMGSRFGAMELTPQISDARLKEALILTMHDDPDPTVRLNALDVLARYPYDAQTQRSLLYTLGRDQEVQLRLSALEQLAAHRVGMETITAAVADAGFASDFAVLERASALTREF
jgi:hypothetical protein